jgi:hypothetical protein
MVKSWSHPESETVTSYIGAVVNAGILLLTIDHWTTEVAAFPLFIFCIASEQVVLVGLKLGPRLERARSRRLAARSSPPGAFR